jgi:hypothetical protein
VNTQRLDLLAQVPGLKTILKSRLFQPAMMLVTLLFFVVAILAGFFGTPAGARNFGIVYIWIVWWALLMLVLVPFFGRLWCTVCPIPGPGEWLQRRSLVRKRYPKLMTMSRRWPRRLKNIWLQNFAFLGVALFSAIILTRPSITAWVLAGLLLLGVALSIVYENRVFCRFVCPVGGFIGLYSLTATVELRVKDAQICKDHTTKDCLIGTETSYGCPWLVFPGNLERNTYCGLCTECLKACPRDNIALNLRPFGSDLLVAKGRTMDEAFKACIMLACALLYSAVLLGPWGWLKGWANMDSFGGWAIYAAGFLAVNLALVPGLFWLAALAARALARLDRSPRQAFVDFAYALVPMGLTAWIAFSLAFVFVNGSYALPVLSDPFGWGWNLFGTRDIAWTPWLPELAALLQVLTLLIGLVFSINIAFRISRQRASSDTLAWRGALPLAAFLSGVTLLFIKLYLG